jgi:hypothetical protein
VAELVQHVACPSERWAGVTVVNVANTALALSKPVLMRCARMARCYRTLAQAPICLAQSTRRKPRDARGNHCEEMARDSVRPSAVRSWVAWAAHGPRTCPGVELAHMLEVADLAARAEADPFPWLLVIFE